MSKGEFAQATDAFERCIADGGHAPLGACFARHGEEPEIVALQYKGLALAVQGFADSGLAAAQSALSLARSMNFPLMVAFASNIVAMVLLLRRDNRACADLARAQIDYCSEQGFIFWSAGHRNSPRRRPGLSRRRRCGPRPTGEGHPELEEDGRGAAYPDLVVLSRRGRAVCRRSRSRRRAPYWRGSRLPERHGDDFALAELHRLTGRLRQRRNNRGEARRAFDEAVAVARRQGARLYLLRAGRDLASLVAEDGDATGASAILKPILAGVAEHRNGLDFQEASALLERLSREADA